MVNSTPIIINIQKPFTEGDLQKSIKEIRDKTRDIFYFEKPKLNEAQFKGDSAPTMNKIIGDYAGDKTVLYRLRRRQTEGTSAATAQTITGGRIEGGSGKAIIETPPEGSTLKDLEDFIPGQEDLQPMQDITDIIPMTNPNIPTIQNTTSIPIQANKQVPPAQEDDNKEVPPGPAPAPSNNLPPAPSNNLPEVPAPVDQPPAETQIQGKQGNTILNIKKKKDIQTLLNSLDLGNLSIDSNLLPEINRLMKKEYLMLHPDMASARGNSSPEITQEKTERFKQFGELKQLLKNKKTDPLLLKNAPAEPAPAGDQRQAPEPPAGDQRQAPAGEQLPAEKEGEEGKEEKKEGEEGKEEKKEVEEGK
jgi:hypothetical protein